MRSRIAETIVRAAPLPTVVEHHLAQTPRWQNPLGWNPHLDPSTVVKMYTPKLRANTACGLVSRPLDDATLAHVVRVRAESRSAVVKALWRHNCLDEALVAELAANGPGSQGADTIVRDRSVTAELRALFAPHASAGVALDFLEANAGVVPDKDVCDIVVEALRWGYPSTSDDQMTNRRMKKALRVLALHPGAVALVAARADEHAAVALAASAMCLDDASATSVIGAVSSLATPGWGATTALIALAMIIDRPDTSPEVAKLAAARMWKLPGGQRAQVSYRLARGHGGAYDILPRSESPLSDSTDAESLEEWIMGRSHRCDGFSTWQHLRAYQFADLALNDHLSPTQARRVADELCRREVRAELGSHLVRARCELLRSRHPRSVRRLPALPRPRQAAPPRPASWSPDPTPPGELLLTELDHPVRIKAGTAHLADALGEDTARWDLALGLADTFGGTIDELIEVAETLSP